ncbi:MAG: exopolysaccharide biosynthesis protein [Acetobacteraceae bacterium]|nr:exopolysaccharide biosynthesis protein [Acetobacteraceae bacterium]
MEARTPTSAVLVQLLDEAPAAQVTLDWLMDRLGDRSFGIVLLLLALLGLLPGVAILAAVMLMVPATQMILARPGPVFPRRLGARRFEVRRLASLVHRATPVLRWLERFIRPRWATPFETTKRVVGGVVLLLAAVALLTPLPLSNVPPALAIMLIAFAYLEEDGVLLCAALAVALAMVAMAGMLAWEAMGAAGWVHGLL